MFGGSRGNGTVTIMTIERFDHRVGRCEKVEASWEGYGASANELNGKIYIAGGFKPPKYNTCSTVTMFDFL